VRYLAELLLLQLLCVRQLAVRLSGAWLPPRPNQSYW
jgi:hypothetical protein